MNLTDRLYTDDANGARNYTPTGLLIQLTYIVGGSVRSATPVVQAAAARIINEIIEAALGSGRPIEEFPEGPHALPAETNYSLIAWLDGLCAAAGADVVEEIICGAFSRSGAKLARSSCSKTIPHMRSEAPESVEGAPLNLLSDALPAPSASGRLRKIDMTNSTNQPAPNSAPLTTTDVLLSLSLAGYGDQSDIRPAFAQLSRETVAAILISATAGGFRQSEILETMLTRGDISERTRAMAEQACSAAGSFLLMSVFAKVLSDLPS